MLTSRKVLWPVCVRCLLDKPAGSLGARRKIRDQHARTAEQFARQAHEQSVLYRFTDRLYRARSMGDVYDASLDAIADGLGCARASILRFDDHGIMRFVAWRNLSAAYRQAVEGHSPWRPGDQNAEPIFIGDVQTADIPEALTATILQEGIRAFAFIPLTIDDKVIGKFMTYFAEPREFTPNELQLSVTIARQLGFSIGRRLADDNARRLSAAEAPTPGGLAPQESISGRRWRRATTLPHQVETRLPQSI